MACRSSKARMDNESELRRQRREQRRATNSTASSPSPSPSASSNGNLLVRGQKWVAINSGREFVRLQGIVRPERHRAGQQRALVARGRCLHLLWRAGHGGQCQQARLAVPLLQFTAHAFLNRTTTCHAPSTDSRPSRRRAVPAAAAAAQAERVKDLASVQGVRSNQLVGYGLVVGLDGTGDQTSQAPFTHPEHQEHADPLRGHHSGRTPTRSSRTWPR